MRSFLHNPRGFGLLIAILSIVIVGATVLVGPGSKTKVSDQQRELEPGSQIYNVNGSSPNVLASLVKGGLADGTIDGGGNIDDTPNFTEAAGPDSINGSIDDDNSISADSPALDAGDNSLLPLDIFDVDGDGDVSEPFPSDLLGAVRAFGAQPGNEIVDIGAYENGSPPLVVGTSGDLNVAIVFSEPFPNPASGSSRITFRHPRSERVTVELYDVLGRKQGIAFEQVVQPDKTYDVDIDLTALASGLYFVHLKSSSSEEIAQLVVVQ